MGTGETIFNAIVFALIIAALAWAWHSERKD